MTLHLRTPAVLIILLALIAAACSGNEDTSTEAPSSTVVATTATPATTPLSTTLAEETPSTTERSRSDETRPPRRSRTSTTAAQVEAAPTPEPVEPTKGTATRYGVVGCSNTDQAVRGYTEISSKDLLSNGDLGGGSAAIWGDPSANRYDLYWGLYDERRPAEGFDGAWVQICLRSNQHGGVFDTGEQALITHIVEQIHLRDPGIPVWVSPLNYYAEGHVCTAVGAEGPAISAMVADWAAANLEKAKRGPDLGPLEPSDIRPRDDCHPNGRGELVLGEQLVDFVD